MKRALITLLSLLLFAFILYASYIYFLISGDTKEYKKQCSKYIPILEQIHKETETYPKKLEIEKSKLDFKYSLQECGYAVVDHNKFIFYFSEGLSVGGYDSKENSWWVD